MEKLPASSLEAITCPACGLLCDDITIARDAAGLLKVSKNGCTKSIHFLSALFKMPHQQSLVSQRH